MVKYQIALYVLGFIVGVLGSIFFFYAVQLENSVGLMNPKTFLYFLFFVILSIFSIDRLFLLF
jgi:hypothetical protein